MKKTLALILALVLAASMFVGCKKEETPATEAPAAEGEVIKIGVFEPLTGENGAGGAQEVDGIKYANSIYSEVLGKKVELVIVDNKSDKAEATTAVTRLIEQEGVVAIIGSYGSGVSIAAGDVIKSSGIPAIGASCTNPMVTLDNDFYFRACFLDPFQGTVMANYAIQQGYTTAAVIMQNGDDYSTGLANFFKNAFVELGGTIVSESVFQTNDTDFNAILTNIKAAAPDVIFAPSSATTAPLLIQQSKALGIEAPLMGGDTWENSILIDVAGADANGVVLSTFFDESDPATEEAAAFITGYKTWLGAEDAVIPAVAALGYDAYIVLLDAIERAGSTDGTAIRDALAATENFEGVTGTLNFDENGDAQKNIAVIKVIEDGQFKYIDTVEVQ